MYVKRQDILPLSEVSIQIYQPEKSDIGRIRDFIIIYRLENWLYLLVGVVRSRKLRKELIEGSQTYC